MSSYNIFLAYHQLILCGFCLRKIKYQTRKKNRTSCFSEQQEEKT